MRNLMKKQSKRFPLLGFKGIMLVVLSSIGMVAFAQSVEINQGSSYTIASTVAASGAATYQWLENGQVLSGATGGEYTVPASKGAGIYRYIRQAKSADCNEWQSSNEFVVTVVGPASTATLVPYMDPRDGKIYQTVKMPDGKTWFAQNLNYTKDLNYNTASNVANGATFTSTANGVPAIGSYWCPPVYWVNGAAVSPAPVISGGQGACDVYGALYTWETAMMVDGKYADDAKTNSVWDESWVSPYYFSTGASSSDGANDASKNNARGAVSASQGGRGICPVGWHVPTDYEWANLLNRIDGNTTFTSQPSTGWWGNGTGNKLKTQAVFTGTDPGEGQWVDNSTTRGTNATGFGAVPAGHRNNNGSQFYNRGLNVNYWSSSVGGSASAWYRYLGYNNAQVYRTNGYRSNGLSVRCVRDS
jgi:uncharacterized protein (TIGR02145 family)